MKDYSFPMLTFALALLSHIVCAQTQSRSESFPSYDQIKPKIDEVVDYVNRSGKVELVTINMFDYPSGSGTYVENDKAVINTKYVRKIFIEKREYTDSLLINKPSREGKRIIKIKYD